MTLTPSKSGRIDPSNVSRSFDQHASSYDKLVGANPGYHEHLRMSARRMGLRDGGAGLRLLDLGCGTGASTAALLDAAPQAEITAVDASAEMLERARAKTWPARVRFVHANVEELDASTFPERYDGILAAYLLRNLTDRNAALRTMRGLLKPGAPLAVHDYSVADSARSRATWTAVCWGVIVPLGLVRTGSADLYRYLWRSVLDFDGVEALTTRMNATGFDDVRVQTVPGWQQDIVHTFLGRAPSGPGTVAADPAAATETDADAPTPPHGIEQVAQRTTEPDRNA